MINQSINYKYVVEWESEHEPDVWLGGFLFKHETLDDAKLTYVNRTHAHPNLNWRIVKHTIVSTREDVTP